MPGRAREASVSSLSWLLEGMGRDGWGVERVHWRSSDHRVGFWEIMLDTPSAIPHYRYDAG